MKRLLTLIVALAASVAVAFAGQGMGPGPGLGQPTSYDPAASAIFAQMDFGSFTAGQIAGYKTCVNNAVVALNTTYSLWSKFDDLLFFAAASKHDALLNWKSPTSTYTETGTLTFTAKTGLTGDGSAAFLTGPTNFSAMSQWTQNSAAASVWLVSTAATGGGELGATSSFQVVGSVRLSGVDWAQIIVNSNASDHTAASSITNASGLTVFDRFGATTYDVYHGGWLGMSSGNSSVSPPAQKPTVFNANGTFSNAQIAFAGFGASLHGGSDAANLGSTVSAFNSCVGAL